MDEIKVMSLEEIRATIGKARVVTLPSGIVVKVRHLTPLDYLKEGITSIPNEFASFIIQLNKGELDLKGEANKIKKNWDLFEKFLTVTIEEGVLEPKMTLRYDIETVETHLLYHELSTADQSALLDAISGR